ncbi:MAG: hypothetical protein P4L80_06890 [Xanthobacteraceae bacterium]|nr:hypothetical protein [Xanthobacteraceae bacterium]
MRVMIAATLASVVALICGFGMFAAFQVSHKPLVRLPSVSAPLQLSADNVATPMAYAAPEPFDRRFQLRETGNVVEAVDALARKIDHRESIQPAPSPEPSAPEIKATAAVEAPKDITPAADDPLPAPDGATAEPAASAVAPAPSVAAVEAPAEPSLSQAPPQPGNEAAPSSLTTPAVDAAKTDATAKEPRHAAARTRHRRKAGSALTAESSIYREQTVQPTEAQPRPARIRHTKIASPKPREPSTATGGPLVSAPGQ